jgi:predicted methyltransferase
MLRTSLPPPTNRRRWMGTLGIFVAMLALRPAALGGAGQNPPRTRVDDQNAKDEEDQSARLKAASKVALQENDKSIKKSVEKLFQLASELKAEVDKTDSVQVLSLAMVRKAEEIEKLAKDIKSRAKG